MTGDEVDANATEEAVYVADLAGQIEASTWVPESLQPAWQLLNAYPFLGGLAFAVAAYLVALLTRSFFSAVLGRLVLRSSWELDDLIIERLRKPVFSTVLFTGWIVAVLIARIPVGGGFIINLFASIITVSWMLAADFPLIFETSGGGLEIGSRASACITT